MNTAGLSLEQAPPISIPLRFFLTAPLFLVLAGVLLLTTGEDIVSSRWHPATMAFTHLITLGVVTMVMCGAMTQMLPVIAGSPLPRAGQLGAVVHLTLTLGTLLLAWGFMGGGGWVFSAALLLLAAALGLFILATGLALVAIQRHSPSTIGMAAALLALTFTLILGLLLGWGMSGRPPLVARIMTTSLHHAWGLGGWMSLLIIAVAYQVIPMFHVTPEYPRTLKKWLGAGLIGLLLAWSLAQWMAFTTLAQWLMLLFASGILLAAGFTWRLIDQRRRKNRDISLLFWRGAILAAGLVVVLMLLHRINPQWLGQPDLLLGVLILFGGVISVIMGMLIKIVPFLAWFHLQNRQMEHLSFAITLPSMKELLPDRRALWLLRLHQLLLALLLAGLFLPWPITNLIALVMIAQGGLLGYLLGAAIWSFHQHWQALEPQPEQRET